MIGYALGVGPLSSGIGRASARVAFALMRRITVRDPAAEQAAQPLSAKPLTILPDPAIGLRPASRSVAREAMRAAGVPLDGPPLVGIALRRWFPPAPRVVPHKIARRLGTADPQAGPEGARLLELVAATLDRLVASDDVFPVFLPTYTVPHEADDELCHAVLDRMKQRRGIVMLLDDPAIYKACCEQLAAFLGGRMHPMILAAAMGTPVVGLAYNHKFQGFLQLIGRADACVEVEDLRARGGPDHAGETARRCPARRSDGDRGDEIARRAGARLRRRPSRRGRVTALQIAADLIALYRAQRLEPSALRQVQEARLRRVVEHAFTHVPFWRRLMAAHGILPAEIRTLGDLTRFPVTTRAELQQAPLADLTSAAFPHGRLEPRDDHRLDRPTVDGQS